jgi:transposase
MCKAQQSITSISTAFIVKFCNTHRHAYHALVDRPMFMDDNARTHRARIVQHFLQQEAVQTIPWPAMSPDMNHIEHAWEFIVGRAQQKTTFIRPVDPSPCANSPPQMIM